MSRWTQNSEERFFAKIVVNSVTECWVWTAHTNKGYGRFQDNGKTHDAHKWAYHHFVGPTPVGLVLDHYACDNRACANPAHLRPVTNRDNTIRGVGPAGVRHRQTECVHGHPFDAINTYHTPKGTRACRRCRADVEARRRERLKCAGA